MPFNPYKGNRGVTRAWHAMKNSLNGFRVAIREESTFPSGADARGNPGVVRHLRAGLAG
ncbi:MAG: Diacylglycerol kinase (EC [Candidatus Burkholderia crenata]|nr:MAG: Diacylglycerol kinase (EC [Candidatus Burkholderia crenata]